MNFELTNILQTSSPHHSPKQTEHLRPSAIRHAAQMSGWVPTPDWVNNCFFDTENLQLVVFNKRLSTILSCKYFCKILLRVLCVTI